MKQSKENIIHSHKDFAKALKELIDDYNLKINSAIFSFTEDDQNQPVISFHSIETGYMLVATRNWYNY